MRWLPEHVYVPIAWSEEEEEAILGLNLFQSCNRANMVRLVCT